MLKIMFMKAKDQKGITAIEYGLIAALIAIGIIAGATLAGDQLAALFDRVATELTAALAG
jgi:pilus assembly protein Flp/PilA